MEDNTIQREGLALVLRQRGFSVLAAADGQEALDLLASSDPGLILLDMLIPNEAGDGWWFLKQQRQVPRLASIPVLITTALSIASKEWAASLGAAGLIRKPIDIEPLLTTILRCLGHSSLRCSNESKT
ncbi:MAG TPA: response regulator [Gemmataceae bacterium]|nr:response regulator [Gemmataceae bacterium]